jgi:hypothetical protein
MKLNLRSEQGHVGSSVGSLVGIAAAVVAAIGISADSDITEIVGVGLFGLAIVLATQVPHLWLKKIYRRIDRITDESDPDRHEGFRLEP